MTDSPSAAGPALHDPAFAPGSTPGGVTRVALDAMGGDDAPGPNLDGARLALAEDPDLHVVLVGDESVVRPAVEGGDDFGGRLTFEVSHGVVGMEEKPTAALRAKPRCSITVCWTLMAERRVDAVVSAGNTGAVVAAGLRTRLFLKGVKRPGIAVTLPTLRGRSILLDVGANPLAKPEHLLQYGVMGAVLAREVLGIPKPRIGLMNIGSEDGKGNELYRQTHDLLRSSRATAGDYVGNVEGRGLYRGEADVLVCEGFVGNVTLKVSEGIAEFLMTAAAGQVLGDLKQNAGALGEAAPAAMATAKASFESLGNRFRYSKVGGAPLLGIDGTCIISHGSSDATAIQNALAAVELFRHAHLNERMAEALAALQTVPAAPPAS
ncbi:phosphate acyltransferase PlsX [Alienimonas californiensis]|uniref:phosphate acyltransferase PlsX n=1 Tax=Alienimonas californiensis TaxID=2527989 RepID=UPI001F61F4EC|nr:phosphate acyltransferase PlsX [Alienimonas californiensis]